MDPRAANGIAEIVVAVLLGLTILTPILALAARIALKPVVEAWTQLKRSENADQDKIMQDRRIALLEAEVQALQHTLQQRVDAQEFDRALKKPVE
jgi:hypothetical protein